MREEKETNESKLKPCPFCGSAVKIENIHEVDESDFYMIACKNESCSASACFGDFSETEDGAVEKWNRRVGSTVVNQNGKHNYSINNCGTLNLDLK